MFLKKGGANMNLSGIYVGYHLNKYKCTMIYKICIQHSSPNLDIVVAYYNNLILTSVLRYSNCKFIMPDTRHIIKDVRNVFK